MTSNLNITPVSGEHSSARSRSRCIVTKISLRPKLDFSTQEIPSMRTKRTLPDSMVLTSCEKSLYRSSRLLSFKLEILWDSRLRSRLGHKSGLASSWLLRLRISALVCFDVEALVLAEPQKKDNVMTLEILLSSRDNMAEKNDIADTRTTSPMPSTMRVSDDPDRSHDWNRGFLAKYAARCWLERSSKLPCVIVSSTSRFTMSKSSCRSRSSCSKLTTGKFAAG